MKKEEKVRRLIQKGDTKVDCELQQTNIQLNKPEQKQCRVCLESEHERENELRCVCNCTGSVKFIHINCLKMWIQCNIKSKSQPELNSLEEKGITCELCKTPIYFQVIKQIRVEASGKIKERIKRKKWLLLILTILLFIMLGIMGFCGWNLDNGSQRELGIIFYIYCTILGVFSLLFIFSVIFLVFQLCITTQTKIGDIMKVIRGKKQKLSTQTDFVSSYEPMLVRLASLNTQ